MYQNIKATAENKAKDAATCWLGWKWCIMFEVVYSTETAAKIIITEENTNPRENPKIMLQTMNPKATKDPIDNMPRRKEKSFFVMNTVAVKPPTSSKVINPAVGISLASEYIVAM